MEKNIIPTFPQQTKDNIKEQLEIKSMEFNNCNDINMLRNIASDLYSLNICYYKVAQTNFLNIAGVFGLINNEVLLKQIINKQNEMIEEVQQIINPKNFLSHKQKIEENKFFQDINILFSNLDGQKEKNFPNINFSENEKKDILEKTFINLDPTYINTCHKMLNENRIFFLTEDEYKNKGHAIIEQFYFLKDSGNYIIVGKGKNFLDQMRILLHELKHIIEINELKEKNTPLEYYGFNNSFYVEVNPIYTEQVYLNTLEEYGIDKNIINNMRYNRLLEINQCLNLFNKNFNSSKNLYYLYGSLLSMYFDSIEDKVLLNNTLNKFNQEKLIDNDIEIFDSVGCSQKVLVNSVRGYMNKCGVYRPKP